MVSHSASWTEQCVRVKKSAEKQLHQRSIHGPIVTISGRTVYRPYTCTRNRRKTKMKSPNLVDWLENNGKIRRTTCDSRIRWRNGKNSCHFLYREQFLACVAAAVNALGDHFIPRAERIHSHTFRKIENMYFSSAKEFFIFSNLFFSAQKDTSEMTCWKMSHLSAVTVYCICDFIAATGKHECVSIMN